MGLSRSLLSTLILCDRCHKETRFLPLHSAIALVGKSRSTLYYWMERRWIHWRELPSGRRLICEASLSRPMRDELEIPPPAEPVRPAQKQSESVRKCPKPSNPVG